MNIHRMSLVSRYGDKGSFEKLLKEGYTDFGFAWNTWLDGRRVDAAFVFYRPTGSVLVREFRRIPQEGAEPVQSENHHYTRGEWGRLGKDAQLTIDKTYSLYDVLNEDWEKTAEPEVGHRNFSELPLRTKRQLI